MEATVYTALKAMLAKSWGSEPLRAPNSSERPMSALPSAAESRGEHATNAATMAASVCGTGSRSDSRSTPSTKTALQHHRSADVIAFRTSPTRPAKDDSSRRP
jgi:hypothetical protein